MARYHCSVYLPVTAAEAWAWHARSGALARLMPPWGGSRIESADPGIEPGSRIELSLPLGPFRCRWVAEHGPIHPGDSFCDRQLHGPFRRWDHVHHFTSEEDGCRMVDQIEYELPLGRLGRALAGSKIARRLEQTFKWRHQRIMADLGRHRDFRDLSPLQVAVSGASGLIGRELTSFLTTGGHTVIPLVRPDAGVRSGIRWDPERGEIDAEFLASVDAVVHLAGSPVAKRWTRRERQRILSSRLLSTRLLAETLARQRRPPQVLVVASGVGYYGDCGDALVGEEHAQGTGFLAEVCAAWEQACAPARDAGIRVVNLRIGMVLSGRGGALPRLVSPMRWGLGATFGSGENWVSWIAIDDLVYLITHAIRSQTLAGPVNAVAPAPVRQRELISSLGRILHRHPRLRIPRFAVRALLGTMGTELLMTSCRVVSRQLEQETFAFSCPDLEQALRWELGRVVAPEPSSGSSQGSWLS